MRSRWAAAAAAVGIAARAITACGGSSDHRSPSTHAQSIASDATAEAAPAPGTPCSVMAPTTCPDPPPHYADVTPILEHSCVVGCHSGEAGGPWPLTDYDHVAGWADAIQADLLHCLMPPADAGIPITGDEIAEILTWIQCGAPQ